MVKISVKEIDSKEVWEKFILAHPEANFLQSWSWGEFHKALGKKIHRTGFFKDDKLEGVMQSVVEDAKRGRYLTVPAGPIIDWEDRLIVKTFVDEIRKIAKEDGCVFVRVRPQLVSSDFSKKLFAKYKFVNAPTHLHAELTSQLNLNKSEDEIMSNMRKATRYEIRKGISQNIVIEKTLDLSLIKKFYDLQIETSKRQKFVSFSYKFLYEQFRVFVENGNAVLYSAKFKNKLLAQAFIIFYGAEAVYHYGATTNEGRKYPGAYLIQWEVIKEAKRRGMKRYNLWGVSPEGQKSHRFYGISVFKRGFGGLDYEYLHAQDLILNYPRYAINYIIETIRKRTRHV